jgi:hypothetical protein
VKIQTFIFAHKQEIIIDYIKSNKFKYLPNVTYLLLGNGDSTNVENLENVVVAKNKESNREQFPLFVAYTGWYCIWKNGLIDEDTDYINLFEYDITLSIYFDEVLLKELRNFPDIVFFTYYTMNSPTFMLKEWTERVRSHYLEKGLDIWKHFGEEKDNKDQSYWSCSTNICLSKNSFFDFMEDFETYFDRISLSQFPGHEFEQSVSFYFLLNNKNILLLKRILTHYEANSHKNTKFARVLNYENIKQDLIKNKL